MAEYTLASVPGPWHSIQAIALNTFREAVRDRVLYLLLAFALILIGVSRALSLLTVGDEAKIIKDVGLSAISVFGVLTAVFVGVSLVFKEIEKRTVYTLLANPVRRWQFVVGKYVGLLAVIAVNVGLMTLALCVVLWIRGENPAPLLPAIVLILCELAIVTAFALLFSSLTNPVLAAVWTFASYVAGHLVTSLQLLQDRLTGKFAIAIFEVVYWLMPNLSRINIRREAVHEITLADGVFSWGLLYGVTYAASILALACLAFERKDFQ